MREECNSELFLGRNLMLRSTPMPSDTITEDYISAGWLLSEMDKAGGRHAYHYVGGKAVTVGLDSMSFKRPVLIGDLVSIYTEIVRLGRTSLVVRVESRALRRGLTNEEKVTEGYFAFVAIDSDRRPVEITNRSAQKNLLPQARYVGAAANAAPPIERVAGNLRIRTIPMPRDTNHMGDVFGGWILSHMDLAGAKTAEAYADRYAVTVGIESMNFHKPVLVGDEVSFYTHVLRTGKTSVMVKVETWARRRHDLQLEEKVTEGIFSYVSVDKNKRPAPIRDLHAEEIR